MSNRPENSPWTVFDNPRPLSIDGGFVMTLQSQFMSKAERDLGRELEVAETMYEKYLAGKPPLLAFQQYLNLFHSI